MKYHCTGCDYIYDEIVGDEDLGIEPKTFFDDLPNDFFCPFCDTHKDDFTVFEAVINYPLDVERLTQFEAEHYPVIEVKEDELRYEIGVVDHPNEENHFIYKVALHDDSGDLIDEHKFQVGEPPKGMFDIEYLDSFELRTYCLRDGIFGSGLIER